MRPGTTHLHWIGCAFLCVTPQLLAQVTPSSTATLQSAPDRQAQQATGSIAGVVRGRADELITGATVSLVSTGRAEAIEVLSGSDGGFIFPSVQAGAFTLTVKLTGFDVSSIKGVLQPGQALELPAIPLTMSTVNFVVEATLPPDLLAAQQLHAEERQRLVGIFPNFFVSYKWNTPPLTVRQKFSLATHSALDPGNIFLAGTTAGVQQAQNAFPGYHQGATGYGKRLGADLANLEIGTYLGGAILPSLFHQDPRYFYKGTGTLRSRFFYAVSRAVISRGDNGKWQPAYAGVLGDLSAGAISNLYYPASDRDGAALTIENGFLGVAGDALNDVFQEFVLKKLTPKNRKTSSSASTKP